MSDMDVVPLSEGLPDLPRVGIGVDVHPFAIDGRTLAMACLQWDGEVLCQSRRLEHYHAALDKLVPHTYWCGCTRREIADSSLGLASDGAHIYPGTCRHGTSVRR